MSLDDLLRECAALRAKLEALEKNAAAQDEVRRSEERLRLAVEASGVGIFDFDPDSGKQTLCPTAMEIWGFEPGSDTNPERVMAAIHPDDRAKTRNHAEASLDPNGPGEFVTEHRLIRPDGTQRWLAISAKAIFAGKPEHRRAIRAVGTMLDVTARKQAESQLQSSEERLRLAVEVAGLGMISIDYSTDLCTLDAIAASLMGFKPHIPIERSELHQRIHFEDRLAVMKMIDHAHDTSGDGSFTMEHRIVLPSGEIRWLSVKKSVKFEKLDGQRRPATALLVVMNVTSRIKAEQSLREHNQQLALLGRVAHELILKPRSKTELLKTVFVDAARTIGAEEYYSFECSGEASLRLFTWGCTNDEAPSHALRTVELLSEHVTRHLQPIVIDDLSRDSFEDTELAKAGKLGACACFPLVASDRLLGTVAFIASGISQFRSGDIETIQAVCSLVSTTLERMRLAFELGESEQRYRTIVDVTSAVTWACPPNGLHVCPQPSWMSFTGQSSSEMLGDGWAKAIHPDDLSLAYQKWNQAVACGHPFSNEHRIRRHDGQWRWMSVSAAPITDQSGSVVEWFGMCLDVTDRKLAEEQLRNVDRLKDEFLATLAHELRNPLTPLRAGVDIIKQSAHDSVAIENARAMMDRQVEQMTRLIDDLMDVSRINSGKITLQRSVVSLPQVIQVALDASRIFVDKKKHQLAIELPDEQVFLNCDLVRLSQVLSNLSNNAAKYTDIGGSITLSVQHSGDDICIQVKDNGIGISSDMLNRVFELFSQVDSSFEKAQGGLGIGLALARRLIEMHGGTLSAASEGVGQGSTFTIHLPSVTSEPTGLHPSESGGSQPTPPLKILVVDDNSDVANVLVKMLSLMGHTAHIAADGLQGLAMAEALKPEVIIMDLGMPKLSGYETCRRIRDMAWGRNILLIALTGWGHDEFKRKGYESGFDHYFTKPLSMGQLADLLSLSRKIKDGSPIG